MTNTNPPQSMQLSFLKQALRGKNDLLSYEMTFLFLVLGNVLGTIPLIAIATQALMKSGVSGAEAMADFQKVLAAPAEYDISTNLIFGCMLLSFVFVLGGLWLGTRVLHKRPFISLINGLGAVRWSRFFVAAGVWFAISALMQSVDYLTHPAEYSLSFQVVPFLGTLLISLFVLPFQTSCEELVFRGWLMQSIASTNWLRFFVTLTIWFLIYSALCLLVGIPLYFLMKYLNLDAYNLQLQCLLFIISIFIRSSVLAKSTGLETAISRLWATLGIGIGKAKPWFPLLLTSVLFGVMHFSNPEVTKYGVLPMAVYYIGFGLFMGLVALLDDGLELSLGLHFGNNFFGATMVSFASSALQTNTVFRTTDPDAYLLLALSAIGATTAFFIFKKRYHFAPISVLFENQSND